MAVVTDPPVQLGLPNYRQSRTEINPMYFVVGTDLYVVQVADQHGVNTIGVFKRALADVGGTWTLMDSAGAPDQGSQQGRLNATYNSGTGIIAILYVLTTPSHIKIVEFDTGTDTYGTATAFFATTGNNSSMGFWQQSGGDYVVLTTDGTDVFYVVNSGGVWGSQNTIFSANVTIYGGQVDAIDTFHFIYTTGTSVFYRQLDVAFSVSGATTITTAWDNTSHRPNLIVNATKIAIGYVEHSTVDSLIVSVGTPLASPSFTPGTIETAGANTLNFSYATPAFGIADDLNVFYVALDYTTMTIIDEVRQSTFDGVSTWSTPIVYYDETDNPPSDGVPNPMAQFIHDLHPIELAQGWTVVTALETEVTAVDYCTGYFLEPPSGPPPTPPTPACPVTPGGNGNVGVAFTATITASGGTPPYTFSIVGGSLPPGLTLDPTTGVISGTPTTAGTYAYTVKVTGS